MSQLWDQARAKQKRQTPLDRGITKATVGVRHWINDGLVGASHKEDPTCKCHGVHVCPTPVAAQTAPLPPIERQGRPFKGPSLGTESGDVFWARGMIGAGKTVIMSHESGDPVRGHGRTWRIRNGHYEHRYHCEAPFNSFPNTTFEQFAPTVDCPWTGCRFFLAKE
jgi:hypothetical protein